MKTAERLRALADWYDQHPQAPDNFTLSLTQLSGIMHSFVSDIGTYAGLGPFKKSTDESYFYAIVEVGDITIKFMASRDKVCVPRVVGKRLVPEMTIQGTPTRIIAAHEEDIIEWDCSGSVLAPEHTESADMPAATLEP